MTSELVSSPGIQTFLDKIAGLDQPGGDARAKQIVRRIVGDLFATIDEFDISEDEFWTALNFVAEGAPEFGLWAPGFGVERFLDIRMDEADRKAGVLGGTPRTIEGPLYVAGAPRAKGEARLDDGSEAGEVLIMHGQVVTADGQPIPNAIVEVWHANTRGAYSCFDKGQSDHNLRRTIEADSEGRYRFRTIMPVGYAVPPDGSTDRLLRMVGRHGKRPAHIHFFVHAPGHRHLTTQINIVGDPYLRDDFAYATRDELIPELVRRTDPAERLANGLDAPYAEIRFDFSLPRASDADQAGRSTRKRA